MKGSQELNIEYLNNINRILSNNPSYLKGYVNYMNDVSIRTKYNYLNHAVSFIATLDKDISSVEFDDFNNYLASIKYKDNGEQTTASYQITVHSALKKFSEYLFYSKKISEHYMLYIKRPKARETQRTIEKRNKGFLTESEIKQVINYIDEVFNRGGISYKWWIRDKAMIYLFLTTGMRCSALRYLDMTDIDYCNNKITITEKGEKVRICDISDDVKNLLNEWIFYREKILKNISGIDPLFISNRKKRLDEVSIINIVKKYTQCIENKNITPHKLRATYGTQLYNKTGDIYFVQQCMGHSNPKVTEIYIRDSKEQSKTACGIMSKLIS